MLIKYSVPYHNCLEDRLEYCTTEHASLHYIDNIVEETGNVNLLVQSAKVFGTTKMYSYINKNTSAFMKAWVTRECKYGRQILEKQ